MYSSYVEGFWSPFSQEFYRIFWEQKSIELSAKRRVASHLGTFDRNRDVWSHAKQRKGLELVKCCLLDFVNLDHLHIFCEVDLPNAQSSGLQANQALYCWSTVDIYFLKIKSQIGAMAKCTFSSSFSSTLSSSWFLSKWLLSTNFRPFRNLTLAPGGKSFPTECKTIVTISEFWEYRQVSDIVVRTGLKWISDFFSANQILPFAKIIRIGQGAGRTAVDWGHRSKRRIDRWLDFFTNNGFRSGNYHEISEKNFKRHYSL